jgi:Flp pilus assembly pilin Flp
MRHSLAMLVRKLYRDDSGQDMIEYALLSGALVIVVAGFLPPQIVPSISTIFSRITSSLNGI